MWARKSMYASLVKHFNKFGFPQPYLNLGIDPIRDWRFLAGDSNSREFEMDKVDKHIGENFGRVLHWLLCSADRMQPGMAVIAYLDQHIELINWIGSNAGYRILCAATELNMSGAHAKLNRNLRDAIDTWVIIVPSEIARARRAASAAQWNQQWLNIPATPSVSIPQEQVQGIPDPSNVPLTTKNANMSYHQGQTTQMRQFNVSPVDPNLNRSTVQGVTPPGLSSAPVPAGHTPLFPQTSNFITSPGPANTSLPPGISFAPYYPGQDPVGSVSLMNSISPQQDAGSPHDASPFVASPDFQSPTLTHTSAYSSSLSDSKQNSPLIATVRTVRTASGDLSHAHTPLSSPSSPITVSPPPYSPTTSFNGISESSFPFSSKRAQSVIRRKAPPPPRKPSARALYSFNVDGGCEEELSFREGDIIEIVQKNEDLAAEGWCKANVKGDIKVGLAPLDYLEETTGAGSTSIQSQPQPADGFSSTPPPAEPLSTAMQTSTNQHTVAVQLGPDSTQKPPLDDGAMSNAHPPSSGGPHASQVSSPDYHYSTASADEKPAHLVDEDPYSGTRPPAFLNPYHISNRLPKLRSPPPPFAVHTPSGAHNQYTSRPLSPLLQSGQMVNENPPAINRPLSNMGPTPHASLPVHQHPAFHNNIGHSHHQTPYGSPIYGNPPPQSQYSGSYGPTFVPPLGYSTNGGLPPLFNGELPISYSTSSTNPTPPLDSSGGLGVVNHSVAYDPSFTDPSLGSISPASSIPVAPLNSNNFPYPVSATADPSLFSATISSPLSLDYSFSPLSSLAPVSSSTIDPSATASGTGYVSSSAGNLMNYTYPNMDPATAMVSPLAALSPPVYLVDPSAAGIASAAAGFQGGGAQSTLIGVAVDSTVYADGGSVSVAQTTVMMQETTIEDQSGQSSTYVSADVEEYEEDDEEDDYGMDDF